MFCASCGAANPEHASVCASCGKPLAANPFQSPTSGPYTPPNVKIPTYLGQSIAVTLCCCLPLGIVAIVYASQVDRKLLLGDVAGATEASNNAKFWSWLSFGLGIFASLAWVAIQVILGILAVQQGN